MASELDDATQTKTVDGRPDGPDTKARPMLIVMTGQTIGRMYALDTGDALIVGRSVEAQIWTDDTGVSRRHTQISLENGRALAKDLGSKNGTFRNGTRLTEPTYLMDGDQLRVGRETILKFTYLDVVTEALQRTLYDAATRDGLTGVYNKRFLREALAKEFSASVRHATPLSFAMLDLDHFKNINDTFGHAAGDKVLLHLAQLLQGPIRGEDVLARYGGEEFALILRSCKAHDALRLAERLRNLVAQQVLTLNGKELRVTVSIGVSTMPDAGSVDADAFLADADAQLYQAKRAGRNCVSSAVAPKAPLTKDGLPSP